MLVGSTAALQQPGDARCAIPAQRHIPGLARDAVPLAEFPHGVLTGIVFQYKAKFFFHNTARFPGHALCSTRACHSMTVSGIRPVCFVRDVPGLYPYSPPSPTPPVFS